LNLKKLKEVESNETYRIEVSIGFAALEDLDASEVDINIVREKFREKIKYSVKENMLLRIEKS
jgi:hypothetical protein